MQQNDYYMTKEQAEQLQEVIQREEPLLIVTLEGCEHPYEYKYRLEIHRPNMVIATPEQWQKRRSDIHRLLVVLQ
jgi:hypothetical protein